MALPSRNKLFVDEMIFERLFLRMLYILAFMTLGTLSPRYGAGFKEDPKVVLNIDLLRIDWADFLVPLVLMWRVLNVLKIPLKSTSSYLHHILQHNSRYGMKTNLGTWEKVLQLSCRHEKRQTYLNPKASYSELPIMIIAQTLTNKVASEVRSPEPIVEEVTLTLIECPAPRV